MIIGSQTITAGATATIAGNVIAIESGNVQIGSSTTIPLPQVAPVPATPPVTFGIVVSGTVGALTILQDAQDNAVVIGITLSAGGH